MPQRDEAVSPQNPPKKSNRNHSACERKKSLNPEGKTGFQDDGNPLSSINHQISSKSHIGDRMQTRTPTKISKRNEQKNISTTYYQKSIEDSSE